MSYLKLAALYISQNNLADAAKLGKIALEIDPSNELARQVATVE